MKISGNDDTLSRSEDGWASMTRLGRECDGRWSTSSLGLRLKVLHHTPVTLESINKIHIFLLLMMSLQSAHISLL